MSSSLSKKFSDFKKGLRYSKYFNSFDPFLDQPEKKFFIYTRGRTGSSVLTDLLNSHPDVYCDYEIFDTYDSLSIVKYPLLYINSCSKRAVLNKRRVYGFKVKIEQLSNEHKYKNINGLIQSFITNGWKVIYLKRSNIFRHSVSAIISNHTKIFHVKNDKKFEHEKINIKCDFLLNIMNNFESLDRMEEDTIKQLPHLRIYYEKDLLDSKMHQAASDKIFNYLKLNSHPVNTRLKKIIPENLENIISNYDEIYDFVSKSKFSKYLE